MVSALLGAGLGQLARIVEAGRVNVVRRVGLHEAGGLDRCVEVLQLQGGGGHDRGGGSSRDGGLRLFGLEARLLARYRANHGGEGVDRLGGGGRRGRGRRFLNCTGGLERLDENRLVGHLNHVGEGSGDDTVDLEVERPESVIVGEGDALILKTILAGV